MFLSVCGKSGEICSYKISGKSVNFLGRPRFGLWKHKLVIWAVYVVKMLDMTVGFHFPQNRFVQNRCVSWRLGDLGAWNYGYKIAKHNYCRYLFVF